ncbi:MAG: hypothetical protein QOG48_91, partial [Verrucomicrobiota bacterium]
SCVQQKSSPAAAEEDFANLNARTGYGCGEELVELVVDVLVPGDEAFVLVLLELEEPPDGSLSFTTVVLLSFFSPPGGFVTVVCFC